MSQATLYVGSLAVGTCDFDIPPFESAPADYVFNPSMTSEITWLVRGKKARKMARQLNELLLPSIPLFWMRHYERVRHHQLRKRWIKKRK